MIHNYLIIFVILIHLSYVFNLKCTNDTVCNNGVCTSGNCTCNAGYADFKDGTCNYQKKEKLTAFLFSILIGATGADWFYLSSGSGNYIAAGIFKLLTGIAGILYFLRLNSYKSIKFKGLYYLVHFVVSV